MARKPRILYPSAFYHVMLRGNNRQEIFFSDENRFYFYSLLADGSQRYKYRVHAFCLMSNHIHLAIETGNVLLPKIMHNLVFRYSQRINKLLGRVGHLFQGRYKAILIDHDSYLITLCRYIHLNPVHAGIVQSPSDYFWSSHRAYLGLTSLPWLTSGLILKQFSPYISNARKLYLQFILSDDAITSDESILSQTQFHGRLLGDETFTAKAFSQIKLSPSENKVTLNSIIEIVCNHFNIKFEDLIAGNKIQPSSQACAFIAALSQEFKSASLVEIGNYLNRNDTMLCNAVKRLRQKFEDQDIYNTFLLLQSKLKK